MRSREGSARYARRASRGVLAFLALSACQEAPVGIDPSRELETAAALRQLSAITIFFGHQSVGRNIIQGIQEIAEAAGVQGSSPRDLDDAEQQTGSGGFFHFSIGKNGDPLGKIRDFASRSFAGVDIAMMKICYVDIGPDTDVAALFREYTDTIQRLHAEYPDTVFVHLTAPLVSRETGPRAWLKGILGRTRSGYEGNLQRQRYNDMMRFRYGGKEPVFDLALIEATDPTGRLQEHTLRGERYLSMYPGYTSDGGHLNEAGRQHTASALVLQLAGLQTRVAP